MHRFSARPGVARDGEAERRQIDAREQSPRRRAALASARDRTVRPTRPAVRYWRIGRRRRRRCARRARPAAAPPRSSAPASMPSVTKWKVVPPFTSRSARAPWCVSTNTGVWHRRRVAPPAPFHASSGHAPRTGPNMLRPRIQAPTPAKLSAAKALVERRCCRLPCRTSPGTSASATPTRAAPRRRARAAPRGLLATGTVAVDRHAERGDPDLDIARNSFLRLSSIRSASLRQRPLLRRSASDRPRRERCLPVRAAKPSTVRTTLDPRLVDPAGNEPGLVVDVRDERRALLFDLGEIERLAPRLLLRVTHAFVTHTHMDHFAGFDHLLALGLGRMPRLVLWGGPGFVEQVEHKLRAYTWNVVHRYEVPMAIEAHALDADGSRMHAVFDSAHRFARSDDAAAADRRDGDLCSTSRCSACARASSTTRCPCSRSRSRRRRSVRVAADRIAAMGLATGAWLRTLKQRGARRRAGRHADRPRLARPRRRARRCGAASASCARWCSTACPAGASATSPTCASPSANVEQLARLLDGVDLLYIESVFLERRPRARAAQEPPHRAAGRRDRAPPAREEVVPFHFSPRYRGDEAALRRRVWRRPGGPDGVARRAGSRQVSHAAIGALARPAGRCAGLERSGRVAGAASSSPRTPDKGKTHVRQTRRNPRRSARERGGGDAAPPVKRRSLDWVRNVLGRQTRPEHGRKQQRVAAGRAPSAATPPRARCRSSCSSAPRSARAC